MEFMVQRLPIEMGGNTQSYLELELKIRILLSMP